MSHFVDIILPLPLDNRFTYSISKDEANFLQAGMRVAVPFGKSKVYTGIIAEVHNRAPEVYEAKPISQILDEIPLVTAQQLKFWSWIASYYMCTEGEVMRAALPGAFILESESIVQLQKGTEIIESELKDDEFLVVEALQNQSSLKIKEVEALLDRKSVLPVLNRLMAKDIVILSQEIYEQYKPKRVKYIKLHENHESEDAMHQLLDELSRAHKQREVVLNYFSLKAKNTKPISAKELQKLAGVTSSTLKSLVKKNIFKEENISNLTNISLKLLDKLKLLLKKKRCVYYTV